MYHGRTFSYNVVFYLEHKQKVKIEKRTTQQETKFHHGSSILPQTPLKKECGPIALLLKLWVHDHLPQIS
jgi:hypothetical protein